MTKNARRSKGGGGAPPAYQGESEGATELVLGTGDGVGSEAGWLAAGVSVAGADSSGFSLAFVDALGSSFSDTFLGALSSNFSDAMSLFSFGCSAVSSPAPTFATASCETGEEEAAGSLGAAASCCLAAAALSPRVVVMRSSSSAAVSRAALNDTLTSLS